MKTSLNFNRQTSVIKSTFVGLAMILLFASTLGMTASTAWGQVAVAVKVVVNDDEADQANDKNEDEDDDWDDEDGWDDVEEDDEPQNDIFANWQTTEAKVMGAKRFLFQQEFQVAIERVDGVCQLEPKQLSKLKIATKGGVKKLIKEWKTETLRRFGGGNNNDKDDKSKPVKEKTYTDIDKIDAQTLQLAGNGFTSNVIDKTAANSPFWKKTLKSVLNEKQEETWKSYLKDQRMAKREKMVDAAIESLNLKLGLTPSQKTEFVELVRPKMMEAKLETVENVGRYYEQFLYYYYASKTSNKKLKAILSKAQLQAWKMSVGPAKNYGSMFGDNNMVRNRGGNVWQREGFGILILLGNAADAMEKAFEAFLRR